MNQFMIQASLEKAEKIIDREKTIQFSKNDAAMIIKMLDNPSKPNAALVKAFEGYAAFVDAKDDKAAAFYKEYGFTPFPDDPLILFMPFANMPR